MFIIAIFYSNSTYASMISKHISALSGRLLDTLLAKLELQ